MRERERERQRKREGRQGGGRRYNCHIEQCWMEIDLVKPITGFCISQFAWS